jgi:hypothetical protein
LHTILTGHNDIRLFIAKIDDTVQETCRTTCKTPSNLTRKAKGRTVPWWTDALTTMRKRTNALRRLYKRTKNNNNLRESRRNQYTTAKIEYQSAIKREKTISWKKHCTATSPMNPWSEIYKIASGKTRQKTTMTTLQKPDGTHTADMIETLTFLMEQRIPEDNTQEDTDYHRAIRRLAEPIDTPDDK